VGEIDIATQFMIAVTSVGTQLAQSEAWTASVGMYLVGSLLVFGSWVDLVPAGLSWTGWLIGLVGARRAIDVM
jgi:hypothetical protein